mgnify:CR=1 FL=1
MTYKVMMALLGQCTRLINSHEFTALPLYPGLKAVRQNQSD